MAPSRVDAMDIEEASAADVSMADAVETNGKATPEHGDEAVEVFRFFVIHFRWNYRQFQLLKVIGLHG